MVLKPCVVEGLEVSPVVELLKANECVNPTAITDAVRAKSIKAFFTIYSSSTIKVFDFS
jgi:hypothetical protein